MTVDPTEREAIHAAIAKIADDLTIGHAAALKVVAIWKDHLARVDKPQPAAVDPSRTCHLCGKEVIPPDKTTRHPSCECAIELYRLRSLAATPAPPAPAQAVEVTEEMVDAGFKAWAKRIGEPDDQDRDDVREMLAAALAARPTSEKP